MRTYHLILFIVVLMSTSAMQGQEKATHSVDFQVFLWPGTPNPNLGVDTQQQSSANEEERLMEKYVPPTIQYSPNGAETVETIQAAVRRLSPIYTYSGEPPLLFFREVSTPEHEPKRVPLGAVNIPANYPRALLLFLPHPESPDMYKIYPIENSSERIKPGQADVHNITGNTLACLFNEKQLILKPGEHQIVSLDNKKQIYVIVRIGSEGENGEWKERYSRQLFVNPNDSLTVLIYNQPNNENAFRIQKITNP